MKLIRALKGEYGNWTITVEVTQPCGFLGLRTRTFEETYVGGRGTIFRNVATGYHYTETDITLSAWVWKWNHAGLTEVEG